MLTILFLAKKCFECLLLRVITSETDCVLVFKVDENLLLDAILEHLMAKVLPPEPIPSQKVLHYIGKLSITFLCFYHFIVW